MGTYTLRVPASRVGYVLEAQGGFSLGPHVQYVLATRTGLGRWVRTAYCGNPGSGALREYLGVAAARYKVPALAQPARYSNDPEKFAAQYYGFLSCEGLS